jgi:hypothetical protein
MDGNFVLIGASQNYLDTSAGAAYLYRSDGATWSQYKHLTARDGDAGDEFGYSLGLSGSNVVVGARANDSDDTDSGSVYVYRNVSSQGTTDPLDRDSDNDDLSDGSEVNTLATDPNDNDTDDDNLEDGWEVNGHSGVNLQTMGANPRKKDLFVEIDWMRSMGTSGHSHKPASSALTQVTASFASMATIANPDGTTGVTLHLDTGTLGGGNQITHDDDLSPAWMEFTSLKNVNFSTSRNGIFKYAIMAHKYNGSCTNNGTSRNEGSDIIIALGCSTTQIGTPTEQATALTRQLRIAVSGW